MAAGRLYVFIEATDNSIKPGVPVINYHWFSCQLSQFLQVLLLIFGKLSPVKTEAAEPGLNPIELSLSAEALPEIKITGILQGTQDIEVHFCEQVTTPEC